MEQCAAPKAHEASPQLNKSNGSAAQIVCFPAALASTMASKQALRDLAIAISFLPPVQCAQGKDQPTPLQRPQSKRRRSERPMLKSEPKKTCSLQAKLQIRVERQVEHDNRPARRKSLEPKAMLRTSERHDGMPAIRRATKVATRQIGKIELVAFRLHGVSRPQRQYDR
ncbi:hypothetical protein XI09_09140 [Bradyrhizobium sp. CCBAU 11386]|nr:hypothetical protein [Bradyrhizobium sp. CCBAU 11386]